MASAEKGNPSKKLWRDWRVMLLSLLLAVLIWLVHNLSQTFHTYLPYRISITSNLTGFRSEAVSGEVVRIRGEATGFYLLQCKMHRGATLIELSADSSLFRRKGETSFRLSTDDIRKSITDALDGVLEIDFIDSDSLTFEFVPQHYRKVPVILQSSFSFREQYMQTEDVALMPDSVLVYGDADVLALVDNVKTSPVVRSSIDGPLQGFVELQKIKDVRIDCEKVAYRLNCERYVEIRRDVLLEAVNVPSDMSVMIIPPRVSAICRIPFNSRSVKTDATVAFAVDCNDLSRSRSSMVIPVLEECDFPVFSYETEPQIVECIVQEKKL